MTPFCLESGARPMPKVSSSTKSYDSEDATSKGLAQSTLSASDTIVYIRDLPIDIDDNIQLEQQIRHRLEKTLKLKPGDIKCYASLGIGVLRVNSDEIKDKLINDFGTIALDPGVGKMMISFVAQLQLVSYIVFEVAKEKKDAIFPTREEVSRRWIELYKCEKPRICEPLSIQFPNIYKIVSTSLDELLTAMHNQDFSIKGQFARIYFCADCSFFEDVPRSVTEEKLRKAIGVEIQQPNISSSSIWLQMNKQTGNACVLASRKAQLWSTINHLFIDGKLLRKKNSLTCRLRIYPVPQSFAVNKIIKHPTFADKIVDYKHHGENLILELPDKTIFDECVTRGTLRVDDHNRFQMEAYSASSNPEESEIDENTWYETEMPRNKSDIMQYVADPEHEIFRYKWNPQIWLAQFNRTLLQDDGGKDLRDRKDTPTNQTRHQLRVTVMLNTLSVVRKKRYMIGDREVKLNIDNRMKTIVYDQRSKLERGGKLSLIKTPHSSTRVDVVNEDCLVAYERLVNNGYNPLLLNMANATTPGGGYRKGDGAQEENLFRRSDYFRSLDVGLDQWLSQRSERFHCSSNCQLDPITDHNSMYPMHEFGAIYTSGLTVFRQSEETGYVFMDKPLEGVCSLAMAAYRDPKLDKNSLASKYAVGTRKKIENTFAIGVHHKHDSLILSAFGCGAFKNPPEHVAQLFASVIEQYAGFFKFITFAIIDDHNSGHHLNPKGNFKPFKDALDGMVAMPFSPMNRTHTMFGPYRLLSDDLSVSDVCIFEKIPCNFGAKCPDIHNRKHAQEFSHPSLCPHMVVNGDCEFMKDPVHMHSFIHRNRCQYGGECRQIDEEKHAREYEHPSYCPSGGDCNSTDMGHLKEYRHLPLCTDGQKCIDYQKHSQAHCQAFRHRTLNCPYGNYCAHIHDKQHQDKFNHPLPPCPFTPFHCKFHMEFIDAVDRQRSPDVQRHCLEFAHVCRAGRTCTDKTSLHLEKSIHIARHICPDGDKCKQTYNEEHLNSFTHPHILDIRQLCDYADECFDRRKPDHIKKFRHAAKFEHGGILRYFDLNGGTNFVQNQKHIVERITAYVQNHNWKPLPSGNVPREIINWVRTVQPVHRCNPIIFESILLHGHVMSREYMENLKYPKFVANSVLQHSRIRRIEGLQEKVVAAHAKEFIIALVSDRFETKGFSIPTATAGVAGGTGASHATHDDSVSFKKIIRAKEAYFSSVIKQADLDAICTKSMEIADASINLHANPSGIGFDKDKDLGTDKTVFSILGPHLGHYYGDVFIVFKRAILHHPDASFSIQAATSFASGNAFHMRPWLGNDPGTHDDRVKVYHQSKLNASIPGYDYATALEIMALTSQHFKLKTMDIDLHKILERWVDVDSHTNIEGHLPQLIPLSYIDHIFIPQNLYDQLSDPSKKAMNANFKHRITVVPHDGVADQPPKPRGPKPPTKSRAQYQDVVIEELKRRVTESMKNPSLKVVRGAAITIASNDFTDHYLLPLTIQQAYEQYCFAKKHPPPDQTTYIYWQTSGGDMLLTLSNEPIESGKKQPDLRCLTCFIAPKPVLNHTSYHEHHSYLDNSPPYKHHILRETGKFAAKSNRFHMGCNMDDFMTFCLEIQRSSGTVTLTHAGPNSIYNHETISHTFKKSELDLTKLNFVHVSAGSRTVPIRNLIICFEKQVDLHPRFDKDFKKIPSASGAHSPQDRKKYDGKGSDHKADGSKAYDDEEKKSPGLLGKVKHFFVGDDTPKLTPCRDNVNCLLQHSVRYASDHNAKYSHPCPFSELCHKKEPYFIHEPHRVSTCKYDKNCSDLADPFHRAEYRHTDLPDFLMPCRAQTKCREKKREHRIQFSHGEQVYKSKGTVDKAARASPPPKSEDDRDKRPPCQWGSKCRDIGNPQHRKEYSHSSTHPSEGVGRPGSGHHLSPCKYGAKCNDTSGSHRAQYSHPPSGGQHHNKDDQRTPCKYGSKCSYMSDANHRATYSHPKASH